MDVAERFECWTCNPEDPSLSPTLITSWICFTENLSFKSSATLVNSQLVCLRPVGILNPVMFNLYVDLIIYSMALKSPDGELLLKLYFCIFICWFFWTTGREQLLHVRGYSILWDWQRVPSLLSGEYSAASRREKPRDWLLDGDAFCGK